MSKSTNKKYVICRQQKQNLPKVFKAAGLRIDGSYRAMAHLQTDLHQRVDTICETVAQPGETYSSDGSKFSNKKRKLDVYTDRKLSKKHG